MLLVVFLVVMLVVVVVLVLLVMLLRATMGSIWSSRNDRYSELRGQPHEPKAEMSYLGG